MYDLENNKELSVVNGVVSLKDGTLFLRQKDRAQRQFDYLQGKSIARQSIINFRRNVSSSAAYCRSKDIPYQHVIFPAKAVAYIQEFKDIGIEITPIVSGKHMIDNVYYPEINSIKKNWFIKDGNHCLCKGYIEVLYKVLSNLGIDIKGFSYTTRRVLRVGDLGVMIGSSPIEREYIEGFSIESNVHSFSINDALPGNTGEMRMKINSRALMKKRILIFGDSFFVGCLNILAYFFEEVFYMRSPFVVKDVANCLEPDYVLTGNAERYLVDVVDGSTARPFFLNYINKNVEMDKLDERDIEAFNAFFSSKKSIGYKAWRLGLE